MDSIKVRDGDGEIERSRGAGEDQAFFLLDPDGTIASWNVAAERLTGWTDGEILGQPIDRLYADADRDAGLPARALADAARHGHSESRGWRVRRDGSRFWAETTIDAIPGDGGEIAGFTKSTRDITRRLDPRPPHRSDRATTARGV